MVLLNNGIDPDDDDDDDEEARKERGGHGPGYFFHNGAHPNSSVEPPSEEGEKRFDGDGLNTTVAPANLSWWWGKQIPFYELLKSGALSKQADGTYRQGGGFTMGEFLVSPFSLWDTYLYFQLGWDNCSDTPVREPLFTQERRRSQTGLL